MKVLVKQQNQPTNQQQISQCKSMQIFYDAQGKLTSQSKVGFSLN